MLTVIALVFALLACGGFITIIGFGPEYVRAMDEAAQSKPLNRAQEALKTAQVAEYQNGELRKEFEVYKETHR